MNKLSKIIIASVSTLIIIASGFALTNTNVNATQKSPILTSDQKKIKEDKKIKVEKMLLDSKNDIIKTFNINENDYTELKLSDMPSFSNGKFNDFSDTSFCNKATIVINNEMKSVTEGSLEPIILMNKNEIIFAYKNKDGNNIIKKYKLNDSNFEKISENSIAGKHISLEQYN